ncbi:ribosome maturation factor RimM [Kozakia baliensis]|uniref:ribosome maturation factor RimM n=1 Tax=Kozakia baliensis TaxID=153496 RepID=UPI00345BFE62
MSIPASQHGVLIATVGRPHGVRGLVRLHAATEDAALAEALGPLRDEQGRMWRVEWRGAGIAALVDGNGSVVSDRDEAAKLVNLKLFAARDQLPEAEEDEFYHADLVGLRAISAQGEELGVVKLVHDYGAGVSLEIVGGAREMIVPFTVACVPEIDLAGGTVTVIPPAEIEVEGDLSADESVTVRQ